MSLRSLCHSWMCLVLAALASFLCVPHTLAQYAADGSGQGAFSIPQAQLMQPDALNRLLQGPQKTRPMILQVGSHLMYSQAHIPGAMYAGPGSQPDGLALLSSKVSSLSKNELIVIYCGCCPWSHCPNIGPAYRRLHDLGYMNVKALYLANNFGDDWVSKGYRVEQGN